MPLVKPSLMMALQIGLSFVTIDLSGYRTGSMNKTLDEEQKYGYGQPT